MYNSLLLSGGAIVDLVALGFVACFAVIGFIHGFTKTFFKTFGTIIALLLAVLLTSSVVNFMEKTFSLVSSLSDSVAGVLGGIIGEDLMNMNLADASEEILKEAGVAGFIVKIIVKVKLEGTVAAQTSLREIICPTFAYYIALILSAIVLFILFKLIIKVLSEIISKHTNIVVKSFDKTLGMVLGLINGLINLEIVIMVISIIPISFIQDLSVLIQTSTITKFLHDINIFGLIMSAISSDSVVNSIKAFIS